MRCAASATASPRSSTPAEPSTAGLAGAGYDFVMTEMPRCRWCRRALPERGGRGRPREFCSQRCRQWDWVARQRARELELSDGELVIAKSALDELHDEL